eukprot:8466963-Heterocapsa_arctica.AAC.1
MGTTTYATIVIVWSGLILVLEPNFVLVRRPRVKNAVGRLMRLRLRQGISLVMPGAGVPAVAVPWGRGVGGLILPGSRFPGRRGSSL